MELDIFNKFIRQFDDFYLMENFLNFKLEQDKIQQSQSITTLGRERRKHFNPLLELSEREFKGKYRYSKENMLKLIEIIRDDLELDRPPGLAGNANQVPVEVQVQIAVRQWGLNELPDILADIHDISVHTLNKICRRVAAAFASKASRYIRMPATLAEKEQVTRNFHAIAGFPQVIGAVASQKIRLHKTLNTADAEDSTETETSTCAMNIQIISDASFKIRDFDYRLRTLTKSLYSKSQEQQIFSQTRIKERFEQNEFRGRLLLANINYACTNYLYTPVAINLGSKSKSFNRAHADTHTEVVEKCLQMWRKRFRIIQNHLTCSSFSGAKHLIVALAVLHNIAIDFNDSFVEFSNDFGYNECMEYDYRRYTDEHFFEETGAESRSTFILKYF